MKTKIEKVWFTGSHGTGKTTQMEYFHKLHPEFSEMRMERRDLHKEGIIKLNREAAPWDEIVIAGTAMLEFLSKSTPFVSDRSWICKCAYSQCLPFSDELLDAYHIINTKSFFGHGENEIYVYFPPMLELEDDGVRSVDPAYQKEVDLLIQFYLNYFQIPYVTITEYSVQARGFQIDQEIFGRI